MKPPDVTTNPDEWEKLETRTPLWKNKIHQDVYSKDGGITYTIATEIYDEFTPRPVRDSRKV